MPSGNLKEWLMQSMLGVKQSASWTMLKWQM